ncbi:DUF637 domain-containing protein [Photorhabdus laumondii]
MSKRNSSVARGTSYLLIYLTAIQPLHPAIAAGISHNTYIKLINNKGNLSKTLKDMGSSDTVKSTITLMAVVLRTILPPHYLPILAARLTPKVPD